MHFAAQIDTKLSCDFTAASFNFVKRSHFCAPWSFKMQKHLLGRCSCLTNFGFFSNLSE